MNKTPEQRFWEKVDKAPGQGPNGDCWLWTAAIDSPGYGAFRFRNKKRNSHRLAYYFTFGDIEPNKVIMHSCDVRLCCNPSHLSQGTKKDNNHDAINKGRNAKGEMIGSSVLTEQTVRLIRLAAAQGLTGYRIAKETGFSEETVRRVISGKQWSHVNPLTDEVAS